MSWSLIHALVEAGRCPWRIVDSAGQEVTWLNDFLDTLTLRALSPLSLRSYAHQLLHFGRWFSARGQPWGPPAPSLITDYLRAQMNQPVPPSASTVNARLDLLTRLCRFHFGPEASLTELHLRRCYWKRSPLGYGRRRLAWAEWRLKRPRPVITPLSAEQVARFWASFHRCRDMALVALLLLNGLRSREVLSLQLGDLCFAESQLRVMGKGRRQRLLPLPPETLRLLEVYLRTERPQTSSPFLFVCLKGPARGNPMSPAGLRSLFRYHRATSAVPEGNPHRFRHTFGTDMIRAGVSLPALMHLMGHADIQTTMIYVYLTPADVWREFMRAVRDKTAPGAAS